MAFSVTLADDGCGLLSGPNRAHELRGDEGGVRHIQNTDGFNVLLYHPSLDKSLLVTYAYR